MARAQPEVNTLTNLRRKPKDDLFEIWLHIASDSIQSADRVEAVVYEACSKLANSPHHGHVRRDLTHFAASILDAASLSQLHHCV